MDNLKSRSSDEDEDLEDLLSTDPESKEKNKDKKVLCKVKWSRDEDEKLKKLVEQHGTDSWKIITNFFPGRTDGQCQHRWQKVLNPELVKGPWTKEEDQKVIDLVHKYGPKRWSVIAKHLQGRIGKQCRERWHNHLNPEVKKSSWTQEEDRIIYEAHKRTDNSIKNHWNSTMRRKVEHEGYLQEGSKSFSSSQTGKRRHRQSHSTTTEPPSRKGSPLPRTQNQIGPYPFDSGHLSNPGFISPSCLDDPDREKRIKELELLLMSAENEVHQQVQCTGPCNMEQYSTWSDSGSSLEDQVEIRSWRGQKTPQRPTTQNPISPSKFLAVEASTVLSSLQSIPEFAETMELIDSDPVTWSDVTSFELSNTEPQPSPNQAGYAVNSQTGLCARNKEPAAFGLGSNSSLTAPITSSKAPHASTEKQRRRERAQPLSERTCSFLENIPNSPKKTPTKSLPFTPSSQFCNILGADHLNLDTPSLTSTPVCSQRSVLNTPLHKENTPKHEKENEGSRTPKYRQTVMIPTPRTPTPFKNALAAQEKMHGPLKIEPQSLAFLEEDIREVLKHETGADIFNRTDAHSDYRAWKQSFDGPARKVRKSLVLDPWEKDCLSVQLFPEQLNIAQLPDESLLTSSSLINTNSEEEEPLSSLHEDSSVVPANNFKLSMEEKTQKHILTEVSDWEAVVYGKTEDQLLLTEQARQYLIPYTSRALVL